MIGLELDWKNPLRSLSLTLNIPLTKINHHKHCVALCLSATSTFLLNTSREGNSTASLGSLDNPFVENIFLNIQTKFVIKVLNQTDPNTECWRIPLVMGCQLDSTPLTSLLWAWLSSQFCSQCTVSLQ